MGLDFSFTCPDIDSGIDDFESSIKSEIAAMFDTMFPDDKPDDMDAHIEDVSTAIYDNLEHYFESVRTTNEDMRKEANVQIDNLEGSIMDLELRLDSANDDIDIIAGERDDIISQLEEVTNN